jgi:hypothetical protein
MYVSIVNNAGCHGVKYPTVEHPPEQHLLHNLSETDRSPTGAKEHNIHAIYCNIYTKQLHLCHQFCIVEIKRYFRV